MGKATRGPELAAFGAHTLKGYSRGIRWFVFMLGASGAPGIERG